jgi:NTE family protein
MNISLALSGGGVKGFAHIGSLRVLEKEGFRIQGMAGTSAGGLVGALYAAGYSPDARRWTSFARVSWGDCHII